MDQTKTILKQAGGSLRGQVHFILAWYVKIRICIRQVHVITKNNFVLWKIVTEWIGVIKILVPSLEKKSLWTENSGCYRIPSEIFDRHSTIIFWEHSWKQLLVHLNILRIFLQQGLNILVTFYEYIKWIEIHIPTPF